MTDTEQSSDAEGPESAAAFDRLYKSGTDLGAALKHWDENVRWLIETALDRVDLINTPEESGLREETAGQLKAELDLLPEQGGPLIPGYARVNLALWVWLEIIRARVAKTMQVVVNMSAEQIYERTLGVLREALLEEERDPELAERENHAKLDAAIAIAKETRAILTSPVEAYKDFMGDATNAVGNIADTFHEAAELLIAQLNLLLEFLNQTEPQPQQTEPSVPRGRIAKTLFKIGIKEGALETAKEAAMEGGKEFLKEAAKPVTFGLSILVSMGLSMREKTKAIAEKRQELDEQRARLQAEPRPEHYMHALRVDLQSGNKLIVQMIDEINDFTNQMQTALIE